MPAGIQFLQELLTSVEGIFEGNLPDLGLTVATSSPAFREKQNVSNVGIFPQSDVLVPRGVTREGQGSLQASRPSCAALQCFGHDRLCGTAFEASLDHCLGLILRDRVHWGKTLFE